MKSLRQWLIWWYGERRSDGKWSKPPFSPLTREKCDATDSDNWVAFDEAYNAYRKHGADGVSFVPISGGPICCDLDGCRDPTTGAIAPAADQILADIASYAEPSPSDEGVRIVALGDLDADGPCRAGNVELYGHGKQHLTITGRRLAGYPTDVRPAHGALRRLQDSLRATKTTKRASTPDGAPKAIGCGFRGSDEALLGRAFEARNGRQLARYWEGEHLGKPSRSEALLGLAQMLAFWTGPDPERLESLLMRSQLWTDAENQREKWFSPRAGQTWGMRYVVLKAIDSCTAFYGDPTYQSGAHTSVPAGPRIAHHCLTRGGSGRGEGSSEDVCFHPTSGPTVPEPVACAWAHVRAGPLPPEVAAVTARQHAEQRRQLAALCWHLAGQQIGGSFILRGEDAAVLLGVERSTISRWLKALRKSRLVWLTRRGSDRSGRASEYVWLGGQAHAAKARRRRPPPTAAA